MYLFFQSILKYTWMDGRFWVHFQPRDVYSLLAHMTSKRLESIWNLCSFWNLSIECLGWNIWLHSNLELIYEMAHEFYETTQHSLWKIGKVVEDLGKFFCHDSRLYREVGNHLKLWITQISNHLWEIKVLIMSIIFLINTPLKFNRNQSILKIWSSRPGARGLGCHI